MHVTDQDGASPLHVAALHGRADLIVLLVKHGASVGARDASQAVPLHLACQQGHFQVLVLTLGQRGQGQNSPDRDTAEGEGGCPKGRARVLPPSSEILRGTGQGRSATGHTTLVLLGWSQPPSRLAPQSLS